MEIGVEITIKQDDDFLKIKETLTRIGILSSKDNTLFQTCHILHKQGNFYIVHFKEMFLLDGKASTISEDDIARRNKIAFLLQDWKLLKIVNPERYTIMADIANIKIISHKDKSNYVLQAKYTIGKKRKLNDETRGDVRQVSDFGGT